MLNAAFAWYQPEGEGKLLYYIYTEILNCSPILESLTLENRRWGIFSIEQFDHLYFRLYANNKISFPVIFKLIRTF